VVKSGFYSLLYFTFYLLRTCFSFLYAFLFLILNTGSLSPKGIVFGVRSSLIHIQSKFIETPNWGALVRAVRG
jgi:hypothetical protein